MNILKLLGFLSPSGEDSDAKAFITATGISNATQKSAINTLVKDLKKYGLWSKMKAIYPFVGGNASSHSFNLINVAQYQITWNGTVTHNSNGIQGNGSNGYGDTGLNPSSILDKNSNHMSVYSRSNGANSGSDCGAKEASSLHSFSFAIKFSDNNTYYGNFSHIGNGSGNFVSNTQGLFTSNREDSVAKKFFKNGSLIQSFNESGVTCSFTKTLICARWAGAAESFSNRNYAFFTIGNGLTSVDISNLYTVVQAFQTTLGRQV